MPSIDDVRDFAAADRGLAVVSYARANGTVHSSVVNAGVMTHPVDGTEVVSLVVRGNTAKLLHWRTSPHASLVFRSGWSWIGVEGPVTLIGPEDLNGYEPGRGHQLRPNRRAENLGGNSRY